MKSQICAMNNSNNSKKRKSLNSPDDGKQKSIKSFFSRFPSSSSQPPPMPLQHRSTSLQNCIDLTSSQGSLKQTTAGLNRPSSLLARPASSNISASFVNPAKSVSHSATVASQGKGSLEALVDDASTRPQPAPPTSTLPAVAAETFSLSEEQIKVMDLVMGGNNIFFTGNAGTGKTFLVNRIIDALKIKYSRAFSEKVCLSAPTGLAATHISGTTINSALGIGAPQSMKDFLVMMKKETR